MKVPTKIPRKVNLPGKSLSKSLNYRIFLLSMIGVLGLVITITLFFINTLSQVQTRINRINLEAVSTFDRFFFDIESKLHATSGRLATQDDIDQALFELQTRNSAFLDVFLIGSNGVILAQQNAISRPKQTEIEHQGWLNSSLTFGTAVIGPVRFEEQSPYVDIATLVTDEIDLSAGFLVARVDLTKLWNLLVRGRGVGEGIF